MSRHPVVVFWTSPDDVDALTQALRAPGDSKVNTVPTAGATGGGDSVPTIVELAPPTLSFVAGVIAAWLGRSASIEIDGIKATDLSRRAAEDLLRERLAKRAQDPDKPDP